MAKEYSNGARIFEKVNENQNRARKLLVVFNYFLADFHKYSQFYQLRTISATSESDGAPCVDPKLSSAESDENLLHQTKTAVPN